MVEKPDRETTVMSRARMLRALEAPALVAVPVALLCCAAAGVSASAALTLIVALLALSLLLSSYDANRPALRQVMPTVVLAALAAAGRVLFAAIPDVKPVTAIVILAGATLGKRDGFMTGALAALVSNVFFGQGPWTPLQMYAWGLVGYLAGVLAARGALGRMGAVCAFGFVSALLYGLILNGWYVVGYVSPLTWPAVIAAFAAGLPLDCVHGAATVAFLLLIWTPWRGRLERVIRRYGLAER